MASTEIDQPQRIWIEGGFHDDWRSNTILDTEQIIPEGCTRIKLVVYELTLVKRWSSEHISDVSIEEVEKGSQVELDSGLVFFGIERPTTVITNDGRIYHDRELLDSPANHARLSLFLNSLQKRAGGKNPVAIPDILP